MRRQRGNRATLGSLAQCTALCGLKRRTTNWDDDLVRWQSGLDWLQARFCGRHDVVSVDIYHMVLTPRGVMPKWVFIKAEYLIKKEGMNGRGSDKVA